MEKNSMCKDPAVEGTMACSRGRKDASMAGAVRGPCVRWALEHFQIEDVMLPSAFWTVSSGHTGFSVEMGLEKVSMKARKAVKGRALGWWLGFGWYCWGYGKTQELPRKENQSLGTDWVWGLKRQRASLEERLLRSALHIQVGRWCFYSEEPRKGLGFMGNVCEFSFGHVSFETPLNIQA